MHLSLFPVMDYLHPKLVKCLDTLTIRFYFFSYFFPPLCTGGLPGFCNPKNREYLEQHLFSALPHYRTAGRGKSALPLYVYSTVNGAHCETWDLCPHSFFQENSGLHHSMFLSLVVASPSGSYSKPERIWALTKDLPTLARFSNQPPSSV